MINDSRAYRTSIMSGANLATPRSDRGAIRKCHCCNGDSSSVLGDRRLPTWTDHELVTSVLNLTISAISGETAAETRGAQ
jgi:hypothetical protein